MSKDGSSLTSGENDNQQLTLEQSQNLIQTKFYAPSIRSTQISRPRLIDLINRGLDRALILVSAPAGYGKTTATTAPTKPNTNPPPFVSSDEALTNVEERLASA